MMISVQKLSLIYILLSKRRLDATGRRDYGALDEVEERVQRLLSLTRPLIRATESQKAAVILPVEPRDIPKLVEAFSCVICKGKRSSIRTYTSLVSLEYLALCSFIFFHTAVPEKLK